MSTQPARSVVVAAIVLAAALWLATVSPASRSGTPILGPGGKQIGVLVDGKARSDGQLTVGAAEFLAIRRMPARARLFISVSPAPGTNSCFSGNFVCSHVELTALPGSPARTSGKGRARAGVVIGREYSRKRFSDNKGAQTFQLQDGDPVLIEVFAQRKRHGQIRLGLATTKATAEIPASSP